MTDRESRRSPRRVYRRPVGILNNGKYEVRQALQLSEGGLVFMSKDEFDMGGEVVASLILPSGGVVVARGKVRSCKDVKGMFQYSVRFAPLSLSIRRLIRNYVSAKTQAEAIAEKQAGIDEAS